MNNWKQPMQHITAYESRSEKESVFIDNEEGTVIICPSISKR